MYGYASDKIRQELVSDEDFSVSDNFPRTGLRVFQIGVIFKAAMDGYEVINFSKNWFLRRTSQSVTIFQELG